MKNSFDNKTYLAINTFTQNETRGLIMSLGYDILKQMDSNRIRIKSIRATLTSFRSEVQSSYCPIEKKIINTLPDEFDTLEGELKTLIAITPDRLLVDAISPVLNSLYGEYIELKTSYMSSNVKGKKGKLAVYYKGILIANFVLSNDSMVFSLSKNLTILDIDELISIKTNNVVKGIHSRNRPFCISLTEMNLLLSVDFIEYNFLTVPNLCGIISHFIDYVYPFFKNAFYYRNSTTDKLEFFVTRLEDGRFFVKDMKDLSEHFSNGKRIANDFARFKEAFENKIPRLKNKSASDFERIG